MPGGRGHIDLELSHQPQEICALQPEGARRAGAVATELRERGLDQPALELADRVVKARARNLARSAVHRKGGARRRRRRTRPISARDRRGRLDTRADDGWRRRRAPRRKPGGPLRDDPARRRWDSGRPGSAHLPREKRGASGPPPLIGVGSRDGVLHACEGTQSGCQRSRGRRFGEIAAGPRRSARSSGHRHPRRCPAHEAESESGRQWPGVDGAPRWIGVQAPQWAPDKNSRADVKTGTRGRVPAWTARAGAATPS